MDGAAQADVQIGQLLHAHSGASRPTRRPPHPTTFSGARSGHSGQAL